MIEVTHQVPAKWGAEEAQLDSSTFTSREREMISDAMTANGFRFSTGSGDVLSFKNGDDVMVSAYPALGEGGKKIFRLRVDGVPSFISETEVEIGAEESFDDEFDDQLSTLLESVTVHLGAEGCEIAGLEEFVREEVLAAFEAVLKDLRSLPAQGGETEEPQIMD